jgi:hypothetical protein
VSLRFGERCREIGRSRSFSSVAKKLSATGIHRSMGSKGDCFDNARHGFATRQEARTAVFGESRLIKRVHRTGGGPRTLEGGGLFRKDVAMTMWRARLG